MVIIREHLRDTKIITMNSRAITHHRLLNQGILHADHKDPKQLVEWMGCMQAQDFAGAKWAIGLRIKGLTEAAVDSDFNEGKILRTHVLRPTWHFVSPEDIRWMLELTAPGIKAAAKGMHRKLEIDERALKRSRVIIEKALRDSNYLTREELQVLLKKARINTDDIRLGFLMIDAEAEGIICSGPRKGKQFTYALLDERAKSSKPKDRDAALAELGRRYFISHGPATVQDFAWWSGLSLADSKKSLEINKKHLENIVIKDQAYWFAAGTDLDKKPVHSIHLLPAYDEYSVAYQDRTDILDPELSEQAGNGIFKPIIVVDRRIVGIWRRTEKKDQVAVELTQLVPVSKSSQQSIAAAVDAYATFTGKKLVKTK